MRVTAIPIFGAKCKWQSIKRDRSTSPDFVARGRALRDQTRLASLATKSTCSKSKQKLRTQSIIVNETPMRHGEIILY